MRAYETRAITREGGSRKNGVSDAGGGLKSGEVRAAPLLLFALRSNSRDSFDLLLGEYSVAARSIRDFVYSFAAEINGFRRMLCVLFFAELIFREVRLK